MADETAATITAVESPRIADETTALNGAPHEEGVATKGSELEPMEEAQEHKRKLSDLEGDEEKGKDDDGVEIEGKSANLDEEDVADAKRQRVDADGVDGSGVNGGKEVEKVEALPVGNGETLLPDTKKIESEPVEDCQKITEDPPQQSIPPATAQESTSRTIEVPNNKVGVLIGKSGETIRVLQSNSGARIQITRDMDADPNASARPVELTGTLENINKAEQLIKDVIAEADAGGSPALVARGFSAGQFGGSEEHEIQVPNAKVGLIIGKGGDTIRNLQTKSQARIQLVPQHLPEGSSQKERIVRITGNKRQIEAAKAMIKEVMNQTPGRPSLSSGHIQNYRPRGPGNTLPPWGPRGPPPAQSHPHLNTAYDYSQRVGGTYLPQSAQYPQQSYGGSSYPQQPSRSNIGWEQRPAVPVQTGSYDYYGGQGQPMGSNPTPVQNSAPVNYNYGQPPSAGSYPSAPQQSYGYNEPKYDNQVLSYGHQQQLVNSQPGFYPQQGSTTPQTGYAQQQPPYSKPAAYAGPPQSFGQPNQGPVPSSYGSGGSTQQSYPSYGSAVPPIQPGPAYGPPSGASNVGYNQAPPSAGYPQPSNQVAAPTYGQGGQPVPAYGQPGAPAGGYGPPYSSAQPSYGEQPAAANANYGYQGATADAGYGSSVPSSGYVAAAVPAGVQPGYAQPGGYVQPQAANTAGYDQLVAPQSGYGSAPVAYAKGVSPQPGGYGGQYDSVQMYGQH